MQYVLTLGRSYVPITADTQIKVASFNPGQKDKWIYQVIVTGISSGTPENEKAADLSPPLESEAEAYRLVTAYATNPHPLFFVRRAEPKDVVCEVW